MATSAGTLTVRVELDASDVPGDLTKAVNSSLRPALNKVEREVDQSAKSIKKSVENIGPSLGGVGSSVGKSLRPALQSVERDVDRSMSGVRSKIGGLANIFDGLASKVGGPASGIASTAAGLASGLGTVGTAGSAAATGLLAVGAAAAASVAAVAAIGAAAAVVGKQFYDLGADADELNDKLAIDTGGSVEQVDALRESIFKLGTTNTASSVGDIGDVAVKVTQNLKLTGTELEEVTSRLTNIGRITREPVNVKSLGDAFKQLKATDLDAQIAGINEIKKVSGSTGLSFNELTAALDSSGAALYESGLNLSQSTALLGQFADAGVDAGEALPGLIKLLREAPKLGMDGQEALQKTVADIQNLAAQGPAGAQRAKEIADSMFGKSSLKLFAAIKAGTIDLNNLKIEGPIEDVNDLALRTADWSERWQILKTTITKALEPFGTAMFNAVNAQLGSLADWITAHQPEIIGFFTGLANAAVSAGTFVYKGAGMVADSLAEIMMPLGDTLGGLMKFQAWVDENIRGDSAAAAESRKMAESFYGMGEGLSKFGDDARNFDATPIHEGIDKIGKSALEGVNATAGLNTELGALPVDGVNVPITVDTTAASTALDSLFDQYRTLSVGVELGDAAAGGVLGGTILGADQTGVRGDVAGLNLKTVRVAAQQYANNCIDAAAQVILSASNVGLTQDQIEKVIPRGGSIVSLAAGLNKLNPAGNYVPMEGAGGSAEALFAAVKASIDKGIGSVLNVAPGSSVGGNTFEAGHFIAITGYDAKTGQINLSDTADGSVYSVSAGDAFQASRGRGIVAGTGAGGAVLPPAPPPPGMPPPVDPGAAPVPITVAPIEVPVVPLFTTPGDDPELNRLQAQADAASNAERASAASKARTEAAQKIADAEAKVKADQAARDTAYSSELLYKPEDRAKADAALIASTKALTEAQDAETELITKQGNDSINDQIAARKQQIEAAKVEPMDYTKLPLGDSRRIAAQAFMGAGGTAEEFDALMRGNAGPAASQAVGQAAAAAAAPIGQAAGDAATAAINTNLLPVSTPTAPDTETNKLLAEQNPAVVAKLAGLEVPDYTKQGGDPGEVTRAGGFDASGRMMGDTAAMIDRTLTSMEAANKARQDQLLAILQAIGTKVGADVVGPIVTASTTAALSGIAADVGTAMGETAGPIIGQDTAAAVAENPPPAQSQSGTSAIPGMAGGGGIFGGTPGRDSVPAMLMPGEYVLTTGDVARMGGFAGVERLIGGLQANGRIQYFASGGGVGRASTGNPNGGQNVNSSVGADFFGVSQIPVLALAINALTEVLLTLIGVEILQRDALIEVGKEFRDFRGDFKAFDAAGRIKNDNSGLSDRSSSSEKQAADERLRILKLVINGIVKYVIEKILVPLGKAIGNAIVSALAGAAGGALSGGGGSIAGGIASAAISAAGAVAIDLAAEVFTIAAETFINLGLEAIGEFLQTIFPNLTTTLLGGAALEQIAGPVSAVMTGAIGVITSAIGNLMGNLGGLFAGFLPALQGFLAGFAPLTLTLSSVVGVLSSIAAVLQQIFGGLVSLGAAIAAPIVAAVTSVLGGFTSLNVSMAGITNVLASIAAILQQIFGSLFNLVSGIVSPITSAVSSAVSGFMSFVSNLTTTTNALGGVAQVLTGLAPNLGSVVSSFGVTGAALSTAMGGIATLAGAVNPPRATVNPVAAAAASTVSTVNQLTAALTAGVIRPNTTTTVNAPITVMSATAATPRRIANRLQRLTG